MNPALGPSATPRSGRWNCFRCWRAAASHLCWFLAALWFVVDADPRSHAATSDAWLGGNGSWTDKHWSVTTGLGYPNNGSPAGTTYAALIDSGNAAISDVTLSTSIAVDSLSVSSGDTLEILGIGSLTIPTTPGAGTITNSGTIKLYVAGNITASRIVFDGTGIVSPVATLSGAGSIVMASNLSAETLITGATGLETLNSSSTIAGAGEISNLNLVNHGTINANVSGVSLFVSPTTTVINTGTGFAPGGILEATGGGILGLSAGTFDNTDLGFPGTISATGSSKIQLGLTPGSTTLIKGGTLSTDSSSSIENRGIATLKDLSLAAGSKYSNADRTTNIEGTITSGDGAAIAMLSFGATSVLQLDAGDATLAGNGSVLLLGSPPIAGNDPYFVRILRTAGGSAPRLTIGAGQTIKNVGQIGNFTTTQSPKLTNHGMIIASTLPPHETAGITIFPLTSADALINDGTLEADDNNAVLTLSGGTVTNFSGASSPGTIVALGHNQPGTLIFERGVNVSGGAIQLDGPLSKLQLNSATAMPDTVANTSGGTITTVAANVTNTLGGAITNSGGSTIVAAAGTSLTIQPTGSGFANSATLRSAAGATLNVVGGYTQTAGDTNVLGTLTVSGGPLVAAGGKLSGTGSMNLNSGFNLAGAVTKQDSGTVTVAGPQNHAAGSSLAINGGRVRFNLAAGTPVSVGAGVSVSVASGATLELAGSVSALSSSMGRAAVMNNGATPAGILVSGAHQIVGAIDGSGATQVNAGSNLAANHIIQSSLVIGGTAGSPAVVTIAASDATGHSLSATGDSLAGSIIDSTETRGAAGSEIVAAIGRPTDSVSLNSNSLALAGDTNSASLSVPAAVPEPSAALLLILGGLIGAAATRRQRR